MKLYGYYRSSTSYRVRIALNLKGVEYENVPVALDEGAQHEDEYRRLNPMGAVPALETDEGVVLQSPAILEYLEERYPEPALLPSDRRGRAQVRAMAALVACDIHPLNNLRVLKYLRGELGADRAAVSAWYAHWISKGFEPLERMVAAESGGEYCHGEAPSIADVCLIPQIYNARRFEVALGDYPTLLAIDGHCGLLDAFAAAHPDRQPDAPGESHGAA